MSIKPTPKAALQILRVVAQDDGQEKTFTNIWKRTRLSTRTVSKWLKELQKGGLINQGQRREYIVTDQGRLFLKNPQFRRLLQERDYSRNLTAYSLDIPIEDSIPNITIPTEFLAIGDFSSYSLTAKSLFPRLTNPLIWGANIIHEIIEELERRGIVRRPHIDSEHYNADLLKWIQKAYDFDLTAMVHFSGKSFLKEQEWRKLEEQAKREDREVASALMRRDPQIVSELRRDWIYPWIEQELSYAHRKIEQWLRRPETELPFPTVATNKESLLKKAASRIEQTFPSLGDGLNILNSIISRRNLEIREMRLYVLARTESPDDRQTGPA